MKKLSLLTLVALLVLTAGCKTPALTRAVVRTTTASTVTLAGLKDPSVVSYMRLAGPVICAAASTNGPSGDVVIGIEGATNGKTQKTGAAILVINSLLSLYDALSESEGSKATPFLQGICDGIGDALAVLGPPMPVGTNVVSLPSIRKTPKLPPHIK